MLQDNETSQTPAKSKRVLWIIVAIAVLVVAASAIAYVVLTDKSGTGSTAVTSPTPEPQVPSKKEVNQIITSVDDEIDQANADQASASAALKDASTPVKADL